MSALGSEIDNDSNRLSRRVTRDSLWLLSGYAVTAGSGFLFWILAARLIPPARLGVDTALLSIISAAAALAANGIGNGVLVMLPVAGSRRVALMKMASLTTLVTAAVAGVIAGFLAVGLLPLTLPPTVAVVSVTGATVLWAFFTLQSSGLTGLGLARWTLFVNAPTNIAKLALLPVIVVLLGAGPHPAVLATLAPAAIATIVVTLWVLPRFARRAERAEAQGLAPLVPPSERDATNQADSSQLTTRFFSYVLRDGPATGLSVGVGLSLSFIVTVLAGPAAGAVFALCYQFSVVLDLVSVGFGASLAMHSASDTARGRAAVLGTWLRVVVLLTAGVVVLIACSPILFALLGSYYVDNGGLAVLTMLAIACILRTPYDLWNSLLRAEHRAATVLAFNTLYALMLVPLVAVLCAENGAIGAAFAMLCVSGVIGMIGALGLWGKNLVRGRTQAS